MDETLFDLYDISIERIERDRIPMCEECKEMPGTSIVTVGFDLAYAWASYHSEQALCVECTKDKLIEVGWGRN